MGKNDICTVFDIMLNEKIHVRLYCTDTAICSTGCPEFVCPNSAPISRSLVNIMQISFTYVKSVTNYLSKTENIIKFGN